MPFCRKCGTKLPEDAKFCGACGTAVTASSEKLQEAGSNQNSESMQSGQYYQADPFGGYGAQGSTNTQYGHHGQNADQGPSQGGQSGWQGNIPYGGYSGTPYGGSNAPYMNQPYYPQNEDSVPLAPDGRKFKNKFAIVGFVFSMLSFFFFILIPIVAAIFVAANPELAETPIVEGSEEMGKVMILGVICVILILFVFIFALVGIILSGIGIAQRTKYRLNGFAIAGLVIGCLSIFIVIVFFAAIS